MCDKSLDKNHEIFKAQVKHMVNSIIADNEAYRNCLHENAKTRCYDESLKALASYRKFELTQMYADFYGNDGYHVARQCFFYKTGNKKTTPENIAIHRQDTGPSRKLSLGSMYHFIWQDCYQMSDATINSENKEIFVLANLLACSQNKEKLSKNIRLICQHVEGHFNDEDELMAQSGWAHIGKHNAMLEKLSVIYHKIMDDDWKQSDIQEFMDKWGKHIINSHGI